MDEPEPEIEEPKHPHVPEREGPPRRCMACPHLGNEHYYNGRCGRYSTTANCPCRRYVSDKGERGQASLL